MTMELRNIAEFNAALQRWAQERPAQEVKKLTTWLGFEALSRIVQRTPVDRGFARGGWQVGIGSSSEQEMIYSDKPGTATILVGQLRIQAAPAFSNIIIYNNVPYIRVLEDGGFVPPNPGPSKDPREDRFGRILVEGGYSVQAPNGMVRITVIELRRVFKS